MRFQDPQATAPSNRLYWRYLHVLLRFFCLKNSISFTDFANDVAKHQVRLDRDHGALSESHDEKSRAVHERVKINAYNFLTKASEKGVSGYFQAFNATLEALYDKHGRIVDGYDLSHIHNILLEGDAVHEAPKARQFFCEITDSYITDNMRARLRNDDPGLFPADAGQAAVSRTIGKVFVLLAHDFDGEGRNVEKFDSRFEERHFVGIRVSSQDDGRFVAHGLKFQRHSENREFTYFSEKYVVPANGLGTNGEARESRGICFFDGGYLKAIGRPRSSHSLTYLTGRLPESDVIDSFSGLITTSNSEKIQIAAPFMALSCDTVEMKQARTGVFTRDVLLDLFDGNQKDILKAWFDGDGKSRCFRS